MKKKIELSKLLIALSEGTANLSCLLREKSLEAMDLAARAEGKYIEINCEDLIEFKMGAEAGMRAAEEVAKLIEKLMSGGAK